MDSLLGQTYENIELICVDDGSTDGTYDLLQEYAKADERVVVIRQDNAGPGVARNRGIDNAHGAYLYFFDSDDFCDSHLVERAVGKLVEDEADMVVLPFYQFDERVDVPLEADWALLRDKYPAGVFSWRDNPDWLFRSFQNFPWNKLMRREFVEKNHVRFQEIYLTEDLLFSASALIRAERITCLDEPLVYHREGTGQNVMSFKDAHPLDFLTAFKTLRQLLESEGLYDQLQVAFVNWAVDGCIGNLHTLATLEGFRLVLRELKQGGLADLGLLDVDPGVLYEDGYRAFLNNVQSLDPDEYLYRLYRATADERDVFRQRASAECGFKLEREQEITWRKEEKEAIARQHEQDIERERGRYDELQGRYDAMANAAEQRVGRAICALPRAIQRAVRSRG